MPQFFLGELEHCSRSTQFSRGTSLHWVKGSLWQTSLGTLLQTVFGTSTQMGVTTGLTGVMIGPIGATGGRKKPLDFLASFLANFSAFLAANFSCKLLLHLWGSVTTS